MLIQPPIALCGGLTSVVHKEGHAPQLRLPLRDVSMTPTATILDASGYPAISYGSGPQGCALAVHHPSHMEAEPHLAQHIWQFSPRDAMERPNEIFAALHDLIEECELSGPQAVACLRAADELCRQAIAGHDRSNRAVGQDAVRRFQTALHEQFSAIAAKFAEGNYQEALRECEFASRQRYMHPDLKIDAASATAESTLRTPDPELVRD